MVGRGPERKKLKKMAGRECEIMPAVSAEALRTLYQNAKAFVFAGVEDFGIAFVESQACGTPVIALDRGGVRDIVRPGVSGILFAEATVDALKKAILDCRDAAFAPAAIRATSLRFSPERFRAQFGAFISGEKKR
jgi:glycosyltransferase involved in cell wall biosynthesis